jgi:O-acetyl-ADP-ribose deacetylase (regulator of RNase III)
MIFAFYFFYRAGDISLLSVDAIVHSTNESMSERNPISDRICARAGPALREEIRQEVKGSCVGSLVDNVCK